MHRVGRYEEESKSLIILLDNRLDPQVVSIQFFSFVAQNPLSLSLSASITHNSQQLAVGRSAELISKEEQVEDNPIMTTTNQSEPLGAEVEEYDYDVMESFDHYDWSELIPTVIVYSIVFVLGICGNGTYPIHRKFKCVV